MHKVFISYHHANDQWAKEALCKWNEAERVFVDKSVYTGDIDDNLSDESIRIKIRDEYLRDSTVTILLVGIDTWGRKHIDWELYSSMRDSAKNKKSGIVVILLPSITNGKRHRHVGHGELEKAFYPDVPSWHFVGSREEIMWGGYEYLPERIVDNLLSGSAKLSITTWDDICENPRILAWLIEYAHQDRERCEYDLSRPMRRRNAQELRQ